MCDIKTSLASVESKYSLAENELRQMRKDLHDYEQLVEDYRTQVGAYVNFLCLIFSFSG